METIDLRKEWTAEQIRELRNQRRQSMEEFGRDLGTSKQLVSLWERGKVHPGYRFLRALDTLDARTQAIWATS